MLWHWWQKEGREGIANIPQQSVPLLDGLEDQQQLIHVQWSLPVFGPDPELHEGPSSETRCVDAVLSLVRSVPFPMPTFYILKSGCMLLS